MLRTFNYTGRKRIGLADISISLAHESDATMRFNANVDLTSLDLPPSSHVYLEAYYQTDWERFSCGSVGVPNELINQELQGFEEGAAVHFRIKVVASEEKGRILAIADNIRPISVDDDKHRDSLLEVSFTDLGPEVWRVRWTGSSPHLEFNKNIPNCKHLVRRDPAFHAFALPAILREILTRLILVDDALNAEEESSAHRWVELGSSLAGERLEAYEPGDEERVDRWIDNAIRRFADDFQLMNLLAKNLREVP